MAKLKCGRLSREVADSCLQYWGGMGFTRDNPISQAYRDSRLVSIGGGADEVMLGIICKLEGTLPGKKPLNGAPLPPALASPSDAGRRWRCAGPCAGPCCQSR
jgi:hypothetical protein